MKNRDIYLRDPRVRKLINEGVANVNDDRTKEALSVLRYELETFVCDGQYEKGMQLVLETFLKNIDETQQPAAWVSGFYGAGKSHLVKILRALWMNEPFEDGETPRETAALPMSIRDLFSELDARAERLGGRHAASGTLGSGASGSVRLALLRIVFKSAGLPEHYPLAKFVMWLENEGVSGEARRVVEEKGLDWNAELDNFYLSEAIHRALVGLRPNQFPSLGSCAEILNNAYKNVDDVSSSDMTGAIMDSLCWRLEAAEPSLPVSRKLDRFPLTLIVLDELQQYIGDDSSRSLDVQEAVESCCKDFGGRLMFVGTGQTAVTGTSNLKKLEGRFTVRVELSDADVDAVIREVILAKRPDAKAAIENVMMENLDEIRRGLSGTTIGHHKDDIRRFVQDYPLLPARGRFWKNLLRVLDRTGTDSQLRNQLGMMHKAIRTNLDEPLGNVLPADYIYFELADRLLQSRVLPRRVYEKTMEWRAGSETERLMARACGLVFLINKLSENNPEIGLSATSSVLADLMTDDLPGGSDALRSSMPGVLEMCAAEKILMRVGDGFRIQTEESVAWNDEFESARAALVNETYRIDAARDDNIRAMLGECLGRTGRDVLSVPQGRAKLQRIVHTVYDAVLPEDVSKKICVWIRDGWKTDEESFANEALMGGNFSPTIFVFIPRASDDLKHHLVDCKAALWTLEKMGRPVSREGIEARGALETIKAIAKARIEELLGETFAAAKVFQAGGGEVRGDNLRDAVLEAARVSASRLYSKFDEADHEGWTKVCESAQRGAPDALKFVGCEDEGYMRNQVCREIHSFVSSASGRSGADVRKNFETPPYGWPRDAVDGAVFVLLWANAIRAVDDRGQVTDHRTLNRSAIAKTVFRVESVMISARQRIEVRKLMQMLEVQAKVDDEISSVDAFLRKLSNMAKNAGGDEPMPPRPQTGLIDDISSLSGNERLLALYENRDELQGLIVDWRNRAEMIELRMPRWRVAKGLLEACDLPGAEPLGELMSEIERGRGLLDEPEPILEITARLSRILSDELGRLDGEYETRYAEGVEKLKRDERWAAIDKEQRFEILRSQNLHVASKPILKTDSPEDILDTLSNCSLQSLSDRIAALPGRFDEALSRAGKLLEPKAIGVAIPKGAFRTEDEIDAWAERARAQLKAALKEGPVYIR